MEQAGHEKPCGNVSKWLNPRPVCRWGLTTSYKLPPAINTQIAFQNSFTQAPMLKTNKKEGRPPISPFHRIGNGLREPALWENQNSSVLIPGPPFCKSQPQHWSHLGNFEKSQMAFRLKTSFPRDGTWNVYFVNSTINSDKQPRLQTLSLIHA